MRYAVPVAPTESDHQHLPDQTTWDCRDCAHPWPCPDAQQRLAAEFRRDRVGLSMYLVAQLHQATRVLTVATPADLYRRFIHWTF